MSIPKEPELVMKQIWGFVLGKKTILKSDHFPGCQNKRLSLQIDGAPNYRQAESLHVHGVAIPTVDSIQNVLDHIGAQIDGKQTHVLWISLREEPVVYINGRPFVLHDEERPFSNLEYTVLVMTAQILLNILRHSIIKMEPINLLILDECHAVKKHPYSLVMSEFYHTTPKERRPSVFGMTAC